MSEPLRRARAPIRMAVLAALLALPPVALAGQGYVPGTQDVPLMPGLTPVAEAPLVFDKPEGRILQADATGAARPDAVRRFYAETLPQLGWVAAGGPAAGPAEGAKAWTREGERLDLGIEDRGGRTFVRFTLAPAERR